MDNELWSVMYSDFDKWQHESKEISRFWEKVASNSATFQDANHYAEFVGKKWGEILLSYAGPDSGVESEELKNIIEKSLKRGYTNSAYYAKNVQRIVNEDAGIGMKALEPAIDKYRISSIIDKLLGGESIDGLIIDQLNKWLIGPEVAGNIARSAVQDTIEANARIQQEAGLKSVMIRHAGPGGCCEWCQKMADGVAYEFGSQPKDFWRVHHDCTCWIEYKPVKMKSQKIRYVGGRKFTG